MCSRDGWIQFSALLTRKLTSFVSCLIEISGRCEENLPVSWLFWSNWKFAKNLLWTTVFVNTCKTLKEMRTTHLRANQWLDISSSRNHCFKHMATRETTKTSTKIHLPNQQSLSPLNQGTLFIQLIYSYFSRCLQQSIALSLTDAALQCL